MQPTLLKGSANEWNRKRLQYPFYAFSLIYRQRNAYLAAMQSLSIGNAKLIYRQRNAYLSATQCLSIGNAKLICRQRNSIASAMYLMISERAKVKKRVFLRSRLLFVGKNM